MKTRITQKWREAEEASNRITRIINTRDCAEQCEPEYWEEKLEIVKDGLEKMSADELGALNSLLFCYDGRVKSEIHHESVQRRTAARSAVEELDILLGAECPSCFGSGLADLRCEGVTPETAAQCSECDGTGTVSKATS